METVTIFVNFDVEKSPETYEDWCKYAHDVQTALNNAGIFASAVVPTWKRVS